MSKTSVTRLLRDHFATFTDVNGKPQYRDWLQMLGVPAILGALAGALGAHLDAVSDMIVGTSIIAGLLFGLLVYVFQLRLQLASDPRVNDRSTTVRLINELFANVAYAVVVGLASSAFLVTCANIAKVPIGGGPALLNRYWSGAAIALSAHLFLTILMCLKRTRTAFVELTRSAAIVRAPDPIPEPGSSRLGDQERYPR